MSVGWGWLAIEIIEDPEEDPEDRVGRKLVREARNELC
jgi:hypothetical protein